MILGIDTSEKSCSVAVSLGDKILCELFLNTGLTHSESLMPIVETCLKTLNINITEIKKIALSNGPGSFTGLRIGASTAIGIAQALKIKIVQVPTLEALAYNLINTNKLIVPFMDARRGQVYAAGFKNGICVIEEQNISFEQLKAQINEPVTFLNEPVRAGAVCLLSSKYESVNYNEVEINYLRKPQAERELLEKSKRTGYL
ncbi:MAG: tRNA (adenosine(37)-N6)-threonylcarbamoyltransferase complex dimerization subunit type 1 TsaB [Defluviitaleaceae bacterium]|nr:tRNA (adenosine(37)-N6)-threonylcarbamoyltransferase complex dimerization subunit type 1 TsaB [Defluviitaleaceae bacterium]